MKKLLLSQFCTFFLFSLIAQQDLSDRSFFVVDSLEYDGVESNDSGTIVYYMKQFHTVEHDTIRLQLLEELFDNLWNETAGRRYVFLMQEMALKGKQASKGKREFETYLFYEGVSYGNLGYLHDVHEELDTAKKLYEKAIPIFSQVGKKSYHSHIICALGLIAEYKGNTGKAIDLYEEAIELAREANDTNRIIYPNNYLAQMHADFKNYKAAVQLHEENIMLAKLINDPGQVANELNSLAVIEFLLKDTVKALGYLQEGINFARKAQNIHLYMLLKKSYANFLYENNQPDSAKMVLLETKDYFSTYEYPRELSSVYLHLGNIASLKKDYRESKKQYTLGLEIAKQHNLLNEEVIILNHLSKINADLGDYALAFDQLQDFIVGRDSLRNKEYKTELLEQAISYEYEKEKELQAARFESDLQIANSENRTQQLLLVIGSFVLLLIFATLLYIYKQLRIIKKQKVELDNAYEELEIQKNNEVLASNLKAIQSQMNPHFIFNALNSIQTFVLKGQVDDSYTYINQFADLIRTTLSFSDMELVSFQEELELLENYLSLEKLRFREDFDYQIIAEDIPAILIPPMLLQPLIENSLIHGLLHKPTDRYLRLNFQYKEEQLFCEIVDNGIGREAAKAINLRKNKKHKSFAINALKRRFEFLSKRFGVDVGFEHTDLFNNGEASGTKVTVHLPFQLNNNV